ncbi:AdoMet-dependent rRNA methyltransferase spb1 [Podospora pseudopauciseta]|uniref:AdoMet-dependent rRNA methyltransferase spb1 n=2 Tax=Podospora TaxID=5144 RepID=A0ABR0HN45_9PEZI|nr:AdoMet-dependent rRNA methyltransferase spb1 [Podospora pseudopauciseta]KAK4679358.1 AdoMet-dependent rRNA methyltransferase spb1 [Podospora pseudoanserina]
MAIQKKHGKGRLDKWYKLAKEKGYRARAAFKLIQLNKKYGFLEKSKVVLDLCAAPGSWCQVAAETMPKDSIIIGVDLSPIKPIPKVITFQSDITTEKCRATIRTHLKTWKADCVLHDGAPNVGTAWVQDSFNQAELALHSLKLATEFLIEGGAFVTKVFRSKDYNSLLWVLKQLFTKVEATKPPSSRNVSAEIFVVCLGYKAPKKLDPRLLDPRTVFEDVADAAPNNEAKVYNPEIKKRKRDGYEEGDYTQYKEIAASEFIQTTDPIAILGQYNALTFKQATNGDVALAALDKLPETTEEIRTCCADLKVLGRKEFKLLLKWRLKVREIFGFPTKKSAKASLADEVAEVEPMDEEMRIQEELQRIADKEKGKKKRERRNANEAKTKEIMRMQMHMTAPMDIGMEQEGPRGEGEIFKLKAVDENGALRKIAKGKMVVIKEAEQKRSGFDSGIGSSGDTDDESDEDGDRLERELDGLYDQYQERKSAADAKYRAKKARKEHDDEEWEGVSADEKGNSDDESDLEMESGSDSENEDEMDVDEKPLISDLDGKGKGKEGLSKRANRFFENEVFADILGEIEEEEEGEEEEVQVLQDEEAAESSDDDIPSIEQQKKMRKEAAAAAKKEKDNTFEIVKRPKAEEQDSDSDWEAVEKKKKKDAKPDIDIVTAEAMTLAHQLARGEKTVHDVIDDGYNKYALKDRDGLPDWFLDDEKKHDKPHKPITKEAAQAIKEKLRAYNARPIKKVAEARARKKFKQAQKLEKLKKKADMLMGDEGLNEKEKASSISKLIAQANKKKRKAPVKVVKAAGANRGLQGRPKGVKGRYKMVDPRMKKEMRALKRVAKKKK